MTNLRNLNQQNPFWEWVNAFDAGPDGTHRGAPWGYAPGAPHDDRPDDHDYDHEGPPRNHHEHRGPPPPGPGPHGHEHHERRGPPPPSGPPPSDPPPHDHDHHDHRGPPPPPGPPPPHGRFEDPPESVPGPEHRPHSPHGRPRRGSHGHGHGHGRGHGPRGGGRGRGGCGGGRGFGRFPGFGPPPFGPRGSPRGFGGPGGAPFDLAALGGWIQDNFINPQGQHNDSNGRAGHGADTQDFTPPIDIFATGEAYVVHASLPGAVKEDIAVNWDAESSTLVLMGVVHRPGDEALLQAMQVSERKVGAFERKVVLGTSQDPAKVDEDGISAKLEDGVLRITVPKLAPEEAFTEVKKVDIQ